MDQGRELDAIARELAAGEISRRSALKRLAAASLGIGASAMPTGLAHAFGNRCPDDRVKCEGKCCPKNARCKKGKCKCKRGYTKCGKKCVDTATSSKHCGLCGNACADGQTCLNHECVEPVDAECAVDDDCPDADSCNPGICQNGTCQVTQAADGAPCPSGNCQNGYCYVCSPTGPEVCDGRDNDCDAQIDEDPVGEGDPCTCGESTSGVLLCAGTAGLYCNCD